MSDKSDTILVSTVNNQQEAMSLLEKLFDIPKGRTVFSEPITVEENTVIIASRVYVGLGFGYVIGGGQGTKASEDESNQETTPRSAFGSSGGGGGGAGGRPVAVIQIGKHGVRVKPVVDITKILLAFFTTLGSLFVMLGKVLINAEAE